MECSRRYALGLVGFFGQLLLRLYRVGPPLPPPPLATVSCSRHSGARRGQPLSASGAAPFITLSRRGPTFVATVRRREVERHLKRSLATLGAPVGQTSVAMTSTFAVGRFLVRSCRYRSVVKSRRRSRPLQAAHNHARRINQITRHAGRGGIARLVQPRFCCCGARRQLWFCHFGGKFITVIHVVNSLRLRHFGCNILCSPGATAVPCRFSCLLIY